MSTHLPGFQSFWGFLHPFVLAKLGIGSIRVNRYPTGSYFGHHNILQKKPEKGRKPWHIGTQRRVISESYPMNTNMTGFRSLCPCALNESSLSIRGVNTKLFNST